MDSLFWLVFYDLIDNKERVTTLVKDDLQGTLLGILDKAAMC